MCVRGAQRVLPLCVFRCDESLGGRPRLSVHTSTDTAARRQRRRGVVLHCTTECLFECLFEQGTREASSEGYVACVRA
jgi:hypothetical protein